MKNIFLATVAVIISLTVNAQISSNNLGGGLWSSTSSWEGDVVPSGTDDVIIKDGDEVIIDVAAAANNLTIGEATSGTLTFGSGAAQTLTVNGNVTVTAGGTFRSHPAGTVTTHVLSVGGNLTNDGTLDFSTNGSTSGAEVIFTGASNNTFGGTGELTNILALTINKGISRENILELNPVNFSVQNISVDGAPMAFLTVTNGTLKVSGTFTFAGRVFRTAAYTIAASAGFWLNNPNFSVSGQAGSIINNGLLRVTQGIFNAGAAFNNHVQAGANASFIIEGGTINVAGSFSVTTSGVTYNQSGGALNVATTGSNLTGGSFVWTIVSGAFIMSGGSVTCVQINSGANRRDYYNLAPRTITGGTLYIGNGTTIPGAFGISEFRVYGYTPAIVVDNTTNNKTATAGASGTPAGSFVLIIHGDLTISSGSSFSLGGFLVSFYGNIINNGTLNGSTASSRLSLGGTTMQTISGTGINGSSAAPVVSLEVNNSAGLTVSPSLTNNIVVSRIILFAGGITNSNKITVGAGGTSSCLIQIGNTTTPANSGNFDVAPTFNVGTGGQKIAYLRVTNSRTTGPEVNPARLLTNITVDDNDPTHTLTIAGGDIILTAAPALTLTNGRVITGLNNLVLNSGTATVTRTNGYVDGNLRKNFTAAASKSFEVGTANGYSPVVVNVTAGTFPADLTVRAVQATHQGLMPALSLQRYWTLTATGVTADLTFNYLNADIPVTATESNLLLYKYAEGEFTEPGGTVNAAANTATIPGVSSFSDWTLAEAAAVLPVSLLSFGGYKEMNDVVLKWSTASEANNRGFEILRSKDGVQYDKIGFVNSLALSGNSSAMLKYTFRDSNVEGTKHYYRLRQVDIDNQAKFSNVVLVSGEKPSALAISSLFPNPASDNIHLTIDAPAGENLSLLITDMDGKVVRKASANVESGSNLLTVNVSSLPNGTYAVKVYSSLNKESADGRFIKR